MQSARRNKQICYSGVFKRHQIVWSRYKQLYRKRTTRTNQRKVSNNLPSSSTRTKRLSGMNTSNPWRKQETARMEQPSKINIKTSHATNKPPIFPTSHQLYVFWCFLSILQLHAVPVLAVQKNWRKTSSSQHPARGGKPSANVSKPGADESCRHPWKVTPKSQEVTQSHAQRPTPIAPQSPIYLRYSENHNILLEWYSYWGLSIYSERSDMYLPCLCSKASYWHNAAYYTELPRSWTYLRSSHQYS